MNDETKAPILVDPNAFPAIAAVILRYALQALGGFLVARGWIEGDTVEIIVSGGLVVAPMAYAAARAHRNRARLVTIAEAAPNDVARVK